MGRHSAGTDLPPEPVGPDVLGVLVSVSRRCLCRSSPITSESMSAPPCAPFAHTWSQHDGPLRRKLAEQSRWARSGLQWPNRSGARRPGDKV